MTESSATKIAGLLLAAGGSSRLGRPKQLVEFEGKTLIRRAGEALIDAGCSPVFVVLGAEIHRSQEELAGLDVEIIANDSWESGMGSSIALGIRSLLMIEPLPDAILISLCDQPFITAEKLRPFLDTFHRSTTDVIAAQYDDVTGVPALFSKALFPKLLDLKGDKGARDLIRNSPDAMTIPLPEAAVDLDANDDLSRLTDRIHP